MSLDIKIASALKLIKDAAGNYKYPVAYSSFGKDSMVMLDLIERAGYKLPIVFHREPFMPKKYEFSNRVIAEKDYVVYDYPPIATAISKNGSACEIINYQQVGSQVTYLPTGIKPPKDGEPYLCGLNDIYLKPKGSYNFPWDVSFIGHKSSDVDPILGALPINTRLQINRGKSDYVFPLADFTDADVWEYTEKCGLLINEKRYDRANGWREFDDITYNPDYFTACVACMDRDAPAVVYCPKINREVQNISAQINYVRSQELPSYIGVSDHA